MDRFFNAQKPAGPGEYLSLVAGVLVCAALAMAFFWWSVEVGVPSLFAKDKAAEAPAEAVATAENASPEAAAGAELTGEATVTEATGADSTSATELAQTEPANDGGAATEAAAPAPVTAAEDDHHEKHSYFSMVIFLGIITGVMASGFLLLLALRRLRDAGKPPLLAALILVPGVNLLALLLLAFLPSGRALTQS
ncbi:MAG: hypothetical protein ACFB20_07120 [Opitutales bacterium]